MYLCSYGTAFIIGIPETGTFLLSLKLLKACPSTDSTIKILSTPEIFHRDTVEFPVVCYKHRFI